MRIIAGQARGGRLAALPGQQTRPTLERVKEGVFSAVNPWLPGARVLDLFAGSGQMGLETVSRGAAMCVLVDNAKAAADVMAGNVKSLGFLAQCRVVRQDAYAFLAATADSFDLVLMDPPYREGHYPALLEKAARVCAPGAVVMCESEPEADMPEEVAGLQLKKQYRYGTVLVSRYRMEEQGDTQGACP